MWELLGIAPTSDARAIRRAYAAKAKTIDADRDPMGFIRLREAYEAALAHAQRPPAEPPPELEPEPDPAPAPEPPRFEPPPEADWGARIMPPPYAEQAETEAFEQAFVDADAERRLAPLLALYRSGLARAVLPLGRTGPLLWRLLDLAALDPAATPAELAEVLQLASGSPEVPDLMLEEVEERIAAEAWWSAMQAEAGRHVILFGKQGPRIADALVGPRPRLTFRPADKAALEAGIAALRQHAPALLGREADDRAELLERRMRRHFTPTAREQLIDWLIVVGCGLTLLLIAKLLPN